MVVRLLLLVLGLFHLGNALWMLAFPGQWAANVVHLPAPVHIELHFIADIGMAFLASGLALLWSARRGAAYAPCAIAGAAWPALHGFVHLREWLMDGVPAATGDILNEGIGVMLAGAAGAVLAWLRIRTGEA